MESGLNSIIDISVQYFRFNEKHLELMFKDVAKDQLSVCPGVGHENHPAWTVGHLCDAAGMVCEMIEGKNHLPDDWAEIFRRKGPGDPRTPNNRPEKYPDIIDVFDLYVQHHDQAIDLLSKVSKDFLIKEEDWAFGSTFPRNIDIIHFMACWHETHHISQLGAWRRAMGFSSVLRPLAIQLKMKN